MLAVWVIVFAVPGAAGIGAPLVPDGGRDEPRKTAKGGKPLAGGFLLRAFRGFLLT